LARPTYSTCIGLILKGYSDYEHNRKQFEKTHVQVEIPTTLKSDPVKEEVIVTEEEKQVRRITNRKGIKDFWGKFKDGIIDLFKEEEDHAL
jgi:cell division protein FtsA